MDRRRDRQLSALLCVHAEPCGGCPLIHLPYEAQLAHKTARVEANVGRYPELAGVRVGPVSPADPTSAYRTRAKLMVGAGGRVGLFGAAGDHEVLDSPECIVLAPALAKVAGALRAAIVEDDARGGPLAPRGEGGGVVALDLRELRGVDGQSEVLVTLVVARGRGVALERLRSAATTLRERAPEIAGVAVNFHDGDSPQVLGQETLLLAGAASGVDTVAGVPLSATFGSFVQAHRGQAAHIHEVIAKAALGEGARARRTVVDLYGGSGAIALSLARQGAEVTVVESFGPAVSRALASAKALGVKLTAERADVRDALRRMVRRGARFDAAVVNPPRRGLDVDVRHALAELHVPIVVYMSCQPETFARDLAHLARLGLSPTSVEPFDMIPLTDEVESVAVLRRAAPPPPPVLYEDRDVVVVDKAPHEPTTPQGEHRTSLLARVRALPGASDAVPVHRLDVGTSGVVVFAKDRGRVSSWARALSADGASKRYLAMVGGDPGERRFVDSPIPDDGVLRQAHTRIERLRLLGGHALVEASPEEGRTHQIRRHLAAVGHAVLGDARYGHAPTNRFFLEKHGLDRTFLHAARLELAHPATGARLVVEAPLAGDLESVMQSLEASRERSLLRGR